MKTTPSLLLTNQQIKQTFFLLLLLPAASQIVFSDKINLFNIKIKTNLQQPSTKN